MSPIPSDIAFQINEWALPQAKAAIANGFFIEAINISVNAITAILRDLILFKVSEDEEYHDDAGNIVGVESYEEHPYLVDLLTNYDNELGGTLSERSIYKESARLKIINGPTLDVLEKLYRKRNEITHRLFGSVILYKKTVADERGIGFDRAIDLDKLKKIACEHVEAFEEIMNIAGELGA